jgi:hypothetical protein
LALFFICPILKFFIHLGFYSEKSIAKYGKHSQHDDSQPAHRTIDWIVIITNAGGAGICILGNTHL